MSHIVVITNLEDAHVPFVQEHMSQEMILIDPFETLNNVEITFGYGTETPLIHKGAPVVDVKSVWYRKPQPILRSSLPNMGENFREYSYSAMTTHIKALYSQFSDAFWLSDYYALQKANNKILQLQIADKLGFHVPTAIFTNNKEQARAFIASRPFTIVKTQANNFPIIDNNAHFFFAKRLEPHTPINLEQLHLAPAIFQDAIDAVADIRVTVVGAKVFAAIIRGKSADENADVRDWRQDYAAQTADFESYDAELPQDIKDKCIATTHALHLRYGAIDLVMDKKGTYWFLEINPNGQWAFVQQSTGQPIGNAVARLLEEAGKE